MFGWLFCRSLVPKDVDVFVYYNGSRWVKGDGLKIMRALALADGMDDVSLATAEIPNKDGIQALGKVIAAVRTAFDLKELSEGGVSDGRCKAILLEFFAWHDSVKKNSPSGPTSRDTPASPEDRTPAPSVSLPTSIVCVETPEPPLEQPSVSDSPSENVQTAS